MESVKKEARTLEIRYTLNENDFLNLQLYLASNDENFKKQRTKDKYRIVILSLLFGLILFFDSGYNLYSYYFLGSALVFLLIHPWWSKYFYKRIFKSRVIGSLKNSLPQTISLTLREESIDLINKENIRSFYIQDLQAIIEIQDYFFFMQVSDSPPIIVPKKEIANISIIYEQLEQYHKDFNIPFIKDLQYKWK